MERGLLAPLSPNEEMALRRIALGSAGVADVHAQRLIRLKLVDKLTSGLCLTDLGKRRLAGMGLDPARR